MHVWKYNKYKILCTAKKGNMHKVSQNMQKNISCYCHFWNNNNNNNNQFLYCYIIVTSVHPWKNYQKQCLLRQHRNPRCTLELQTVGFCSKPRLCIFKMQNLDFRFGFNMNTRMHCVKVYSYCRCHQSEKLQHGDYIDETAIFLNIQTIPQQSSF